MSAETTKPEAPKLSWRDIPVPHTMAKVIRWSNGIPVPYVAAWEEETPSHIGPDPMLKGKLALFHHQVRGGGKPNLGEMDPWRQRRCMLNRLCQVCERPICTKHGWMVNVAQHAIAEGDVQPLIREPFVCPPCLWYSLQVCPGLITAWFENPIGFVMRVVRYKTMLTFCMPDDVKRIKGHEQVGDNGVVSYVKALVEKAHGYTVDEALEFLLKEKS